MESEWLVLRPGGMRQSEYVAEWRSGSAPPCFTWYSSLCTSQLGFWPSSPSLHPTLISLPTELSGEHKSLHDDCPVHGAFTAVPSPLVMYIGIWSLGQSLPRTCQKHHPSTALTSVIVLSHCCSMSPSPDAVDALQASCSHWKSVLRRPPSVHPIQLVTTQILHES